MRLHGLVKLLNFFQALLNYLMLESVMLLARDAGPAPAPGKMAAPTLKIFKTAPPEDSYPGPALPLPDKFFFCPAPLCPEAKKAALCIPTFGNVVVVLEIGSWVLPLSLNYSLVRQLLDLPSEVLQ